MMKKVGKMLLSLISCVSVFSIAAGLVSAAGTEKVTFSANSFTSYDKMCTNGLMSKWCTDGTVDVTADTTIKGPSTRSVKIVGTAGGPDAVVGFCVPKTMQASLDGSGSLVMWVHLPKLQDSYVSIWIDEVEPGFTGQNERYTMVNASNFKYYSKSGKVYKSVANAGNCLWNPTNQSEFEGYVVINLDQFQVAGWTQRDGVLSTKILGAVDVTFSPTKFVGKPFYVDDIGFAAKDFVPTFASATTTSKSGSTKSGNSSPATGDTFIPAVAALVGVSAITLLIAKKKKRAE